MNFFENDYAVPVILGGGKEAISTADILRDNTDLKIHIFADRLSCINKLKYRFHKMIPSAEDILLLSLNDFADGMHEYYTPILIFTDARGQAFIEENFDSLEQRYVIISSNTAKNYFSEGGIYNEDQ